MKTTLLEQGIMMKPFFVLTICLVVLMISDLAIDISNLPSNIRKTIDINLTTIRRFKFDIGSKFKMTQAYPRKDNRGIGGTGIETVINSGKLPVLA